MLRWATCLVVCAGCQMSHPELESALEEVEIAGDGGLPNLAELDAALAEVEIGPGDAGVGDRDERRDVRVGCQVWAFQAFCSCLPESKQCTDGCENCWIPDPWGACHSESWLTPPASYWDGTIVFHDCQEWDRNRCEDACSDAIVAGSCPVPGCYEDAHW